MFDCSCPDGADMCKHVAAVLYGIGSRLDRQPELLFTLRSVDAAELLTQSGAILAAEGGPGDVSFRRDLAPRHREAVRRSFGGGR